MTRARKYVTFQQSDGSWVSGFVADTQVEAWKETMNRAKAVNGDAILKGEDGRIRLRRTYRPRKR